MQRSPRASFSPMMMSYPETSWTQGSFTQPSSRKRAEHQTSYLHSNCSLGVACESPSCCYLLFEGGFKTVCVLSSLTCARVNTAWHSKGRVLDIFIPYKLLANIQSPMNRTTSVPGAVQEGSSWWVTVFFGSINLQFSSRKWRDRFSLYAQNI